ncbi:hypothetical protein KM043_008056 [Ampulex compressa]|nr:hypothetical protein KM043_008056 [Ampulex compressa]
MKPAPAERKVQEGYPSLTQTGMKIPVQNSSSLCRKTSVVDDTLSENNPLPHTDTRSGKKNFVTTNEEEEATDLEALSEDGLSPRRRVRRDRRKPCTTGKGHIAREDLREELPDRPLRDITAEDTAAARYDAYFLKMAIDAVLTKGHNTAKDQNKGVGEKERLKEKNRALEEEFSLLKKKREESEQ